MFQFFFHKGVGRQCAYRHPSSFSIQEPGIRHNGVRIADVVSQQRPDFRDGHLVTGKIAATGYLDGIVEIGKGGKNLSFALSNVLGQRAGDGVLQQFFVAFQRLLVHVHNFLGVEVQRHHGHSNEHTDDQIKNGYSGWKWQPHTLDKCSGL